MRCQGCERELSADDVVYRAVAIQGSIWREKFGNKPIGSLCHECVTGPAAVITWSAASQLWRPAEPCSHCGHPVIVSGRRPIRKHVACSRQCSKAVYNRRDGIRKRSHLTISKGGGTGPLSST